MADLEESSLLRLIYDANDFDALGGEGLPGLAPILYVSDVEPRTSLLPLAPGGRAMFGMMSVYDVDLLTTPEMRLVVSERWVFSLEWDPSRSAWNALLHTLDHLHMQAFALAPEYVLPALFVARMADQPKDMSWVVSDWGPSLAETYKALSPFLLALYESWIDGPSQTAAIYRQFVEHIPADDAAYHRILDPYARLFGLDQLEEIRAAEHLESAILRQLDVASTRLWESAPGLRNRQGEIMDEHPYLRGLLPLALWKSEAATDIDLIFSKQITSLQRLKAGWQGTQP